jgi:hypothetical protein
MKHLTTTDKIRSAGRPIGNHVDNSRIDVYINEAEQMNIKPQIGDDLYIKLVDYVDSQKASVPEYNILLEGGRYISKCGENKFFQGLIESLNYYVWARIVKNNNYTVTRFGVTEKQDSYSKNAEIKARQNLERDALNIADNYMAECIDYMKDNCDKFPKFKPGKQKNRSNIVIIGD